MPIIRNLNLISVQSWTYLQNNGTKPFIWKFIPPRSLFSCKTNSFSYERFCKRPRFETEAHGERTSEMAYCKLHSNLSNRSIFHLIGSCDKYINPAETRRIFSCQQENHSTMTAFIIFGHIADTTCMFI